MTPKEQAVLLVPSMTGASAAVQVTVTASIIVASLDLPVSIAVRMNSNCCNMCIFHA